MRPNLFKIATKELSQDAFITWLLQFADDKYQQEDADLNACGKEFITQLIKKQIADFNEPIRNVKADRQWKNIDIRAKINDKYLIIIEDKTFSQQHSNQLKIYKDSATKWCKEEGYEPPICIYLKTGNESNWSFKSVENEGYSIFNRIEFLDLLTKFKEKITNNIFIDFRDRLLGLEELNSEFEGKFIKEWNGNDWQGFFQFLETELNKTEHDFFNWLRVNNASGGFWGAILNWDYWQNTYPVYLQIEEENLCIKISTDPKEHGRMPKDINRARVRNDFFNLVMKRAKVLDLIQIKRPKRFGNGNYMTVAIHENWLNKENKLDKENVLKSIDNYLNLLRGIQDVSIVVRTNKTELPKPELE